MLNRNEMDHGLAHAFAASVAANPLYTKFRLLPVCQELGTSESVLLFSCFDRREIEAGQVIYEAQTPSENEMYLIMDGRVSVANSEQITYAKLAPGDVFGLFSFLDEDRRHAATLKAETDLVVLTVSRSYFNLITLEDPELGNLLLRLMFRLLSRMALKLDSEYAAIHQYATSRRI